MNRRGFLGAIAGAVAGFAVPQSGRCTLTGAAFDPERSFQVPLMVVPSGERALMLWERLEPAGTNENGNQRFRITETWEKRRDGVFRDGVRTPHSEMPFAFLGPGEHFAVCWL